MRDAVVTFGVFTFDHGSRELRCGGASVHLSPKAVDLLALLIKHRPKAISKTDLHRALWPDTFVTDASVAVLVAEIRRALGDSWPDSRFIRTVNRFGYSFMGAPASADSGASPAVRCLLNVNGGRIHLKPGENLLGRDPEADVCVDAVGISRRHAVMVVSDDRVTLADLNSKNGTFVNGVRVESLVVLPDIAEIRLGAVAIQFQRTNVNTATQTIATR